MAKLKATPKTFEQALAVLGNKDSVKLGNNTWLESYADATSVDRICVRLHNTNIVTFYPDGRVILSTGGYYKRTTKDRLNRFIDGRVFSKNWDWFYAPACDFDNAIDFEDGINVGQVPLVLVGEEVKSETPDFRVQNEGTIFILYALTDEARQWVETHLPEDVQTWGVNGYVVEHGYILDILDGIKADGFTIEQFRGR